MEEANRQPAFDGQEKLEIPQGPRLGPTQMAVILNRYPRLMDRMAIAFAELVQDVSNNELGKPGEMVLKLTVARPDPKKGLKGRELFIGAEIRVKAPNDPPSSQVFYFDDEGGVHDRDPYQRQMFDGPRSA